MNKDTPQAEKNYTQRRLAEFDEKFCDKEKNKYGYLTLRNHIIRSEVADFLSTSIHQALAEERERMRGIIDWELTPHGYESDDPQFERFALKIKEKYKNKILSSLDKPLTDNKDI